MTHWTDKEKQALLADYRRKAEKGLAFWSYALAELGNRRHVQKQMWAILYWADGTSQHETPQYMVDEDIEVSEKNRPVYVDDDLLYGEKPDDPLLGLTRSELRTICDHYDGLRRLACRGTQEHLALMQTQAAEMVNSTKHNYRKSARNLWLYCDMLADGNLNELEMQVPVVNLIETDMYYWHAHGSEEHKEVEPNPDLVIGPDARRHRRLWKAIDKMSETELYEYRPTENTAFLPYHRSWLREYTENLMRSKYDKKSKKWADINVVTLRAIMPESMRCIYLQGEDPEDPKIVALLKQEQKHREWLQSFKRSME